VEFGSTEVVCQSPVNTDSAPTAPSSLKTDDSQPVTKSGRFGSGNGGGAPREGGLSFFPISASQKGHLRCRKSFPQSMLMIINGLTYILKSCSVYKLLIQSTLSLSFGRRQEKKGNQKMKVCLQKLLKTHGEKMSDFCSEQKLLKNKQLIIFLKVCS